MMAGIVTLTMELVDSEAHGIHPAPASVGEDRRSKRGSKGYDAGKKIKGRKRHILTDDPASAAAGSPGAVGPDVFRAQLRLPAETLRPSGGGPSTTLHC